MSVFLTRPVTSRRRSLALGLAAFAGLRQSAPTAGKRDRCRKKAKKNVAKTCGRQFEPCLAAASPACDRNRDPAACQSTLRECCGHMGRCDLESYLTCVAPLAGPADPV